MVPSAAEVARPERSRRESVLRGCSEGVRWHIDIGDVESSCHKQHGVFLYDTQNLEWNVFTMSFAHDPHDSH